MPGDENLPVVIMVSIMLLLTLFALIRHMLGKEVAEKWRSWKQALLLGGLYIVGILLALPANGPSILYHLGLPLNLVENPGEEMVFAWLLLPSVGGILAVKLCEKWFNGRVSEKEKTPGMIGFKAWLSPWNLILAVGLALCLRGALGVYLPFALFVCVGLLLIYPIAMALMQPTEKPMNSNDLSPERERILRLLEQGKITADEGAELLSALAPLATANVVAPWTRSRRLLIVGGLIVLIGFFLPWIRIDAIKEVQNLTAQLGQQMGIPAGLQNGMPNFPTQMMVNGNPNPVPIGIITANGGDMGYGLGWIMLALSLVAASLPYIAVGLGAQQQTMVTRIAVFVALILGLYIASTSLQFVSYGLPIAIAGLAIQVVGLFVDLPRRGRAFEVLPINRENPATPTNG